MQILSNGVQKSRGGKESKDEYNQNEKEKDEEKPKRRENIPEMDVVAERIREEVTEGSRH